MKIFVNKFKDLYENLFYVSFTCLILSTIFKINWLQLNNIYFFDLLKFFSLSIILLILTIFFFSFSLFKNIKYLSFFFLIIIIFLIREKLSINLINFRSELILILLILLKYFLTYFKFNVNYFFYFILFNNIFLIFFNFPNFLVKLNFFYLIPVELYSGDITNLYENHKYFSLIEQYNSTYVIFFCFFIININFLKIKKSIFIYLINFINFLIIYYSGPDYLKFTIILFSIFYFFLDKFSLNNLKKITIFFYLFMIVFSIFFSSTKFQTYFYKSLYFIETKFFEQNHKPHVNNSCVNNEYIYQHAGIDIYEKNCLIKFQYPFYSLSKRIIMQQNYNNIFLSKLRNILFGLKTNDLKKLEQDRNFTHNSFLNLFFKYGSIVTIILCAFFLKSILSKNNSKLYLIIIISFLIMLFFDDYLVGNKIATSFFLWIVLFFPNLQNEI